jgi:hypothetical protein
MGLVFFHEIIIRTCLIKPSRRQWKCAWIRWRESKSPLWLAARARRRREHLVCFPTIGRFLSSLGTLWHWHWHWIIDCIVLIVQSWPGFGSDRDTFVCKGRPFIHYHVDAFELFTSSLISF